MLVVDVEASGIVPAFHSILSIGAVDFTRPERQFYGECRLRNGAKIMREALAVNGFTEAQCRDRKKQTLSSLMRRFMVWAEPISDKTLVAQNVSFDRDFINDSLKRSKIPFKFSHRTVDLHTAYYIEFLRHGMEIPLRDRQSALGLKIIASYLGIPAEPEPHNALVGAKYQAEALARLLYGKNLLPEFAQYPVRALKQRTLI